MSKFNHPLFNLMSPLVIFIIFIVALTFIIVRYTFVGLKEPMPLDGTKKIIKSSDVDYWKNAETTNGRLAMMGLFALIVNYGLFGWIIPGFF